MKQVKLTIKNQFIADGFWEIIKYADIQFTMSKVLDEYYLYIYLNDFNNLQQKINNLNHLKEVLNYPSPNIDEFLPDIFENALIIPLTNLGE